MGNGGGGGAHILWACFACLLRVPFFSHPLHTCYNKHLKLLIPIHVKAPQTWTQGGGVYSMWVIGCGLRIEWMPSQMALA